MKHVPFPEDDWKYSKTRRVLIIVAAIVLIALALIMLAGPSNVLVLLHLKDLETEPVVDYIPDAPTIMTLEELRTRVVNTRPRLEAFQGFPCAKSELSGTYFYIYAVESGFELQFEVYDGDIRSVMLYPKENKQNRLSVTDGVTPAVFDLFVNQE